MYTLVGEDPELTEKIERMRALCEADGIFVDTADYGGVRTEEDTNKILKYRDDDYVVYVAALKKSHPQDTPTPKEVWRPIAPFGLSLHNWGCARDFKVLKKPDSFTESAALQRMGKHAVAVGLEWGGNFRRKPDTPHVQLPLNPMTARARWESRHPTGHSKPADNQV